MPLNLEQAELWVIQRTLEQCDGNVSQAARQLGINRGRIYWVLNQAKR